METEQPFAETVKETRLVLDKATSEIKIPSDKQMKEIETFLLDADNNKIGVQVVLSSYSAPNEPTEAVVTLDETPVRQIVFEDATPESVDKLRVDEIEESEQTETNFEQMYAIDPTEVNFTTATVTVTAKGTELYKCKEWNFDSQTCSGSWVLFKTDLVPGQEYSFELTQDDPAFGEILITKADHLDFERNMIGSIYGDVRARDDIWSKTINEGEYVRVMFEKELSSDNDITIYPRIISGSPRIEIYEKDGTSVIAEFSSLLDGSKNYLLLSGLTSMQDTFDLKVVGGSVQFDYVVDPTYVLRLRSGSGTTSSGGYVNVTFASLPDTSFAALYNPLNDDDTPYSAGEWSDKKTTGFEVRSEDDAGAAEPNNFLYGAIPYGYYVLPTGQVIQCGNVANPSSPATITFSTAMPSSSYAITCSAAWDDDTPRCGLNSQSAAKSTTGFGYQSTDDGGAEEVIANGLDYCAFTSGEYNISTTRIKAGTTTAGTVNLTVLFTTAFPDTNYALFIAHNEDDSGDVCECEITARLAGRFTARCEDDGGTTTSCASDNYDWVAFTLGNINATWSTYDDVTAITIDDVSMDKSSYSWFDNAIINITLKNFTNGPVLGAEVNLTVIPPTGRYVYPRTVYPKDDGVSPDATANDGVYTIKFDISLNGSAETTGSHVLNITARKAGMNGTQSSSNSLTTYALRRWWGSAGVEDSYADYTVTKINDNLWTHQVSEMLIYSPNTASSTAVVKIPIINHENIGLMSATNVNSYSVENGNTIVFGVTVTSGGTTTIGFTFNASSDLILTHNDRYQTQTIGVREGKNGFTLWNSHLEQEIFGVGKANSVENGETSMGPYATGENVGTKIVNGESADGNSHTADCMERTGIPSATSGTLTYDTCGSCNSYYEWNIHWTNPIGTDYEHLPGTIIFANSTYIRLLFEDDPDTNQWASTNKFNVTKQVDYYADKKYYRYNFTTKNIGASALNSTLVWGREPWMYAGGAADTNDRGALPGGRYPWTIENQYTWEELGGNWIGFYDNATNYGTAIIFPRNAKEDSATLSAFFTTVPLGTNAGQNPYPWTVTGTDFPDFEADGIFSQWQYDYIQPGDSVSTVFYHWVGANSTGDGLIGEMEGDALEIHNLNSGGQQQTDITAPTVKLIEPTNNSADGNGQIVFKYNVTDASQINNCTLIFNGVSSNVSLIITKNIQQELRYSTSYAGSKTWGVSCLDEYGNTGLSETRTIHLNLTNSGQAVYINKTILLQSGTNLNATLEFIDYYANKTDANLTGNASNTQIASGKYDISIQFQGNSIQKIYFEDVNLSSNTNRILGVDEPAEKGTFEKIYVLDPTQINFTNATVTVTATSSNMYKCAEWDFEQRVCLGGWNRMMSVVPGQNYTFLLTQADPGFGEIGITNCSAEDSAATSGSWNSVCDNQYPGSTLYFDDSVHEIHTVRKQGQTGYWAGLKLNSSNSSLPCDSISNVYLCYKWWAQTSDIQNCNISIDSDGGASFTPVITTCPGTSEPSSLTCTDVTSLESWSCANVNGSKGALIKSEVQNNAGGSNGYFNITWDVLYLNFTYGGVVAPSALINDTYVSQANPTTNYGSETDLSVGDSNGQMMSSLLDFAINVPQGAKVNDAKLRLYFYDSSLNPLNQLSVSIKDLDSSWDEGTVSWNTKPAISELFADYKDITNNYGWVEFNVTNIVQKWANKPSAKYGLILQSPEEFDSNTIKHFYSSEYSDASLRPNLTIIYSEPVAPEVNIVWPTNEESVGTGNFHIDFTIQDNLDIVNCSLFAQGIKLGTRSGFTNGLNTLNFSIAVSGTRSINISCTNEADLTGSSNTVSFTFASTTSTVYAPILDEDGNEINASYIISQGTTEIVNKKDKKVKENLPEGNYDFNTTFDSGKIKSVKLNGLSVTDNKLNLFSIDNNAKKNKIGSKVPSTVYAIDTTGLDFTSGTVYVDEAAGDELYKCTNWNFANQQCDGTWTFLQTITPGQPYTITITPGDPGYAEINIIEAKHLDSSRVEIEDIYANVSARDTLWKAIPADDYVRVTYEKQLMKDNDITIYARSSTPGASVTVYEEGSGTPLVNFGTISANDKYRVLLTDLSGLQDTFDLKVTGGDVEFDYITDPDWWNSSFTKRKPLNITNNVGSTLTSFPAYVAVDYDADMQVDFDDIRITNVSCGNALGGDPMDFEIEKYNTTVAHLWIRVPTFTAGINNFCMYYGNSTVGPGNNTVDVWDNNFVFVHHLAETSGLHQDSTANNNDAKVQSVTTQGGTIGRVDGADLFVNASNNLVNVSNNQRTLASGTMSVWINQSLKNVGTTSRQYFFSSRNGTNNRLYMYMLTNQFSIGFANAQVSVATVLTNESHEVTLAWSGSTYYAYVDGRLNRTASAAALTALDKQFHIGNGYFAGTRIEAFNGIIDEARYSNTTRTQAWINQSYQTVKNENTLVVFGVEESGTVADSTAPVISNIFNISISNSSALINWTTSESANGSIKYGTTVALGTTIANATSMTIHSQNITGLINGTRYYYNITSCDASGNCNMTGPWNFITLQNTDVVAPAVTNVINISISNSSAVINWTTSESANASIKYGTTVALGTTIANAAMLLYHNQNLTGLINGTRYYYNITSCDTSGNCNISGTRNFITLQNADSIAPVISALNISGITNQSATINWTTNENANTSVKYGTTLQITSFSGTNDAVTAHSRTLTGLSSNTLYYYNITSCDAFGNCQINGTFSFTTQISPIADTTAPTVALNSPGNGVQLTSTSVSFICTGSDNINLSNMTLYFNSSSTLTNSEILNWQAFDDPSNKSQQMTASASFKNTTFWLMGEQGLLVKYVDNSSTGVLINLTGGGGSYGTGNGTFYEGTDAYEIFNGKVNVSTHIWYYGTNMMQITFRNLDPSMRYRFVHHADRGSAAAGYPGRNVSVIIYDVDSFDINASVGTRISTRSMTDDTVNYSAGNNVEGYVAAWRNIDPGADGDFVVNVTNESITAGYVSAILLEEYTPAGGSSSTAWHANQTVAAIGTSNQTTFSLTLSDNSSFNWNCLACDTSGLCNFSATNRTFSIQTTSPDEIAPVITNVQNTSITNQSAEVSWTTDENANSSVNYGTSVSLGTTTASVTSETSHSMPLTGLLNYTRYYYNITSCDASGNCNISGPWNFITEQNTPPPQTNITIVSPTGTIADHTPVLNVTIEGTADQAWYVLDGASGINICTSCTGTQTKFIVLEEGSHTLTAYVNNTQGTVNYSTVPIIVDFNKNFYDTFNDNSSIRNIEGAVWNEGNVSFTGTAGGGADPTWYNSDWIYRNNITIPAGKVTTNISEYPLLVSVTDAGLASYAQENGGDILFVDANGNKLNHEIDIFNKTSGVLVAWVKLNVSSASATNLKMYYGNSEASNQQSPANVWNANYAAVWHMNIGNATHTYDSSGNERHGKFNGTLPRQEEGVVGYSQYFNGINDLIYANYSLIDRYGNYSVSMWVYSHVVPTARVNYFGAWTDIDGLKLRQLSGGRFEYSEYDGTSRNLVSTFAFDADTWYHITAVKNTAQGMLLYIDGKLNNQSTFTGPSNLYAGGVTTIGARAQATFPEFSNGTIDEIRVSNVVLNPEWINASYQNQLSPSTFYTMSSQEEYNPGTAGAGSGNFTIHPINTTENVTGIVNITWTTAGTDASNNVSVQLSSDAGSNWISVLNGYTYDLVNIGKSLILRIFFQTDSATTIALTSLNVSWNETAALPDETSPVISNINISGITNQSATINWTTNENANTSVKYGTTIQITSFSGTNDAVTAHSITLTGLNPNTLYYYNITSCDASGNCQINGTFSFTTQVNPPEPEPAKPVFCGLHNSHTTISDGSMTPAQQMQVLWDNYDCGGTNDHDYQITQTEWTSMIATANANNTDNELTVFFGTEWTSASVGEVYYVSMTPSAANMSSRSTNFDTQTELSNWLSQNQGLGVHNHPARDSGGTDFSSASTHNETWIPLAEMMNQQGATATGNQVQYYHWDYYWNCTSGSGCTTYTNPTYTTALEAAYSSKWIKWALDHGQHIGFSCGNDYHGTYPLNPICHTGLAKVENWTRLGVYDALKARHTWTSENKTIMNVTALKGTETKYMGDIFNITSGNITIDYILNASPGNTINNVSLFYNGVIINVTRYSGQSVVTGRINVSLRANTEDYIFLEAIQSNKQRAWSSPMWVTYAATSDLTAPEISGVWNYSISNSAAVINWTTDEAANSSINYGTTINLGTRNLSSAFVLSRAINITGLSAHTTYYYNVTSCDASGNCQENGTFSFTTSNSIPTASNVRVNSTSQTNYTTENLTLYWSSTDADNERTDNVTDWRINGQSMALVNLPFEEGSNSTTVRDYSTNFMHGTLPGTGLKLIYNGQSYEDLTSVSDYVIQAGDCLEYDVYWDTQYAYVAIDFTTDVTELRSQSATDQNGESSHANANLEQYAWGKWYHRNITIPAGMVGQTISYYDLVQDGGSGVATAFFKDIKITDCRVTPTTRKTIYNGGAFTHATHISNAPTYIGTDYEQLGPHLNGTAGYDGGSFYSFDGVTDDIFVDMNYDLSSPKNISLFLWANPDIDNAGKGLIQLGNKFTDDTPCILINVGASSKIGFFVSGGYQESGNYDLDLGRWQMIGLTYNSTEWRFYKDGVLLSSYVNAPGGACSGSDDLYIGNGWEGYFDGKIDNVLFFNRTLTQEQILILNSTRINLISSQETEIGENWSACVTPNDGIVDGTTVCSNNVTILMLPDLVAPVISNVANISISNSSSLINWTTDEAANGSINYGTTVALGTTIANATSMTIHSQNVTGLLNYTRYYYNITSCDASGNCNISGPWNFITLQSVPPNNLPVVSNVRINSTYFTNYTTENLTVYWSATDGDNEPIVNITDWKVNGTSIALLNMPFEGSSTSANDYSTNDADGTVTTAVWCSDCGYDGRGAYTFDGVSRGDWITIPANKFTNGAYTKVAWFKKGAATGTYYNIISGGNHALWVDPTGNLTSGHNGVWTFVEDNTGAIVNGQWYHVALTYDPNVDSGTMKLYKDGVLVDSSTGNGGPAGPEVAYFVGAYDGGAYPFNGTIDNVYVFNRSLSAEQIYALYSNRTDLIVSQETSINENWTACVTGNDGTADGTAVCSNEIIIMQQVNSITIDYPTTLSVVQRYNRTHGELIIHGTYVGSPSAIEASFNGGTFTTINSSPSGGKYYGRLNATVGQGNLTVRFSGNAATATTDGIGIGDIFVIMGQSNAAGWGDYSSTLNSSNPYNATVFKAGAWYIANDPVVTAGSPYPKLADYITQQQNIPVGYIASALGGIPLDFWTKGGTDCGQGEGMSCYDIMINQTRTATNGTMRVKSMLFYQGERDTLGDTPYGNYASYKANLTRMADDFIADTAVATTIIVGQVFGEQGDNPLEGNRFGVDEIRRAQRDAWDEYNNVSAGPTTYDMTQTTFPHFTTKDELHILAKRWFASVNATVYGGTPARGPIAINASFAADDNDTLLVTFNTTFTPLNITPFNMSRPIGTIAQGWRIVDTEFNLTDANVTSAVVINSNQIQINLTRSISASAKLWLGSHMDGSNKNVTTDNSYFFLPAETIFDMAFLVTEATNTAPVINWVNATPNPILPTQILNISANVTDDNAVSQVWVEFNSTNRSMMLCGTNVYCNETINISTFYYGTYNYTVFANDSYGLNATEKRGTFDISMVISMTVYNNSVNFTSGEVGSTLNAANDSGFPAVIENTGNVNFTLNISGTNMSGTTAHRINPDRVEWSNLSSFATYARLNYSENTAYAIVSMFQRKNIFFRLNVPTGIPSQVYTGNLTFTAESK